MFRTCYFGLWQVFPVPTGGGPPQVLLQELPRRLPRPHGGGAYATAAQIAFVMSSPSLRGCFHPEWQAEQFARVFPVPTGVFLQDERFWRAQRRRV